MRSGGFEVAVLLKDVLLPYSKGAGLIQEEAVSQVDEQHADMSCLRSYIGRLIFRCLVVTHLLTDGSKGTCGASFLGSYWGQRCESRHLRRPT